MSPSLENDHKTCEIKILWRTSALLMIVHLTGLYGLYLMASLQTTFSLVVYAFILINITGLGITAGAHRLWAHQSYKARFALRLFLAFGQTMSLQNDIHNWVRDHRVHHKYSETDADPHNARRGLFFSHIGWLFCRKHPDVTRKGKRVNCDDLFQDPIVRFQVEHYKPLAITFGIVLPTLVPHLLWNEQLLSSLFVATLFRIMFTLHSSGLINSFAHKWGQKPYDTNIGATDNQVMVLATLGEGFHNYHHTFPWDYAASEMGWRYNVTTIFIDTMSAIGQAYNLKKVTPDMIRKRKARTGGRSHRYTDASVQQAYSGGGSLHS